MTTISFNLFIRAFAITLVVFNHAYIDKYFAEFGHIDGIFYGLGFSGGASVLLMVSGFNFAEFILTQPDRTHVRSSIIRLARKIFLPSFLLVLFYFVVLQEFNIAELFFYRNWLTLERIAKYPTWYPQVVLQIFLFLYMLVPLCDAWRTSKPLLLSCAMLAFAIACFYVSPVLMQATSLGGVNTPLHHLWNFIIGWVLYYATQSGEEGGKATKILGSCVLIACVSATQTLYSLQAILLLTAGMGLLWVPFIAIPAFAKHTIYLVSQATFTIFLFHRFFFEIMERLYPAPYSYVALFFFGMICSLTLWLGYSAFIRSYEKVCLK